MLRAAAAAGVRRVVVTSSSVTCGSSGGRAARDEAHAPNEEFAPAYFDSKVRQEQTAFETGAELGVEVVVACPTVVLGGPATRLVPSNAILLRYLLDPTRSTYPGGCNVVALDDVARGHVLVAERGTPGERYLLGGENVSWRLLHTLLAELAGVPGPFAEVSTTMAVLAAAASELDGLGDQHRTVDHPRRGAHHRPVLLVRRPPRPCPRLHVRLGPPGGRRVAVLAARR